MYYLDLTLDSPAENLALDEALLDAQEAKEISGGVLRLWESPTPMVVLGRSSPAESEVNLDYCHQHQVPVLRRSSGGGTVVAGPGCLMYAVVLDFATYPQLRAIDRAHQFVLSTIASSLSNYDICLVQSGISDLAIPASSGTTQKKCSGNALRIKRNHLLYHGTLLYDFDTLQAENLLGSPTREPEYRQGRGHSDFVTNMPLTLADLKQALSSAWIANQPLHPWPTARVTELIQSKYQDNPKWTIYAPPTNS